MTLTQLTFEDLQLEGPALWHVGTWLDRGDGVAVYENADYGSAELGDRKLVSYGSSAAQIEEAEPPTRLPDIGSDINWRYQLVGVYTEN